MTINDLELFLYKVHQLNMMVQLIENDLERREKLISCETHDQVVKLASEWGYDIGRRWGEGKDRSK